MHKHHNIPKSRGGTDDDWNMRELSPYDHAYEHALDFVLFDTAPAFDFRFKAWPMLPEDLRKAVLKEKSRRNSKSAMGQLMAPYIRNSRWFNKNGKNVRLKKAPEGWLPGRHGIKNDHDRGERHWFNNGTEEKWTATCPEGFRPGRKPNQRRSQT